MEYEEGVLRDEVQDIIGALADIKFDVRKILWYIEGDDDEWEEAEEAQDPPGDIERLMAEDENYQRLLRHLERLRIELETGKRPPPDFAPQS